jgi:hypothetical protein
MSAAAAVHKKPFIGLCGDELRRIELLSAHGTPVDRTYVWVMNLHSVRPHYFEVHVTKQLIIIDHIGWCIPFQFVFLVHIVVKRLLAPSATSNQEN